MKIYIGNMSYDVHAEDLREAFGEFGDVDSADIIVDKSNGRSKGFGFVEMPNKAAAQAAIAGLNGKELKGRAIMVNEAKPKTKNNDSRGGNKSGRGGQGSRGHSGGGRGGSGGGFGGRSGGSGGNR